MAFATKDLLILTALPLLAISHAHALVITNKIVARVETNVTWRSLRCLESVSGNATPLTDMITTTLLLNGQPIASSNTALDETARIVITSSEVLNNILSLSSLKVRVALPIANCAAWANTNGALEGPVQVGSFVDSVLTLVANTLRLVA